MKATGIVRRIDELGRVVIPKEIRSTLRLKSGDPLEIFTERDELMLKKYSPITTIESFSQGAAKSLNDLTGLLSIIVDTDGVVYAHGSGKKEYGGKTLSKGLYNLLSERKSYLANLAEGGDIIPVFEGGNQAVTAQVIIPVVSGGDLLGAVILISFEQGIKIDNHCVKLAQLTANILANQFE